jgi:hypothetical protein
LFFKDYLHDKNVRVGPTPIDHPLQRRFVLYETDNSGSGDSVR